MMMTIKELLFIQHDLEMQLEDFADNGQDVKMAKNIIKKISEQVELFIEMDGKIKNIMVTAHD